MGLFRPSRETKGPDPHLDKKIGLFFLAAVLAIIGMVTEEPWTIYAAILVLLLAFLLRFLPQHGGSDDVDSE